MLLMFCNICYVTFWPDFDYFRPAYIITQSYEKVKHIGHCVGDNVGVMLWNGFLGAELNVMECWITNVME